MTLIRIADEIKDKILALCREKYHDFGPPFACEKLLEQDGIKISDETMTVSMGFRISGSLYSAIQTTWRLTFAMPGLSPADHTSLNWTHFRTWPLDSYGSC